MKNIVLAGAVFVVIAAVFARVFVVPQIEGEFNTVAPHEPYQISAEAQALHDSLFVADLHTDSLLWSRNLRKESDLGHVDLPRLQRGNVALQVFSATTKSPAGQNYQRNTADSDRLTALVVASTWPVRTWQSIYERAVYQLEQLKALINDSGDEMLLVLDRSTMQTLVDRREAGEKVIGAIYLIEGAHPLEGDIANLDRLYAQGLRIAGFTHFFDNRLGGSLHGVSGEGLTVFGREVLGRMNELGIIIDVAHASPQMVSDILELSTAPVMLSHGGVKGTCDKNRNLDDELMVRMAEKGGIVGIGYWEGAVCDITPAGIVNSIRYAIDLMGVEHVALGSDYDGSTRVLLDTSELAVLTQEMIDQGFTEDEIRRVMGDNVKRFLLENLPAG